MRFWGWQGRIFFSVEGDIGAEVAQVSEEVIEIALKSLFQNKERICTSWSEATYSQLCLIHLDVLFSDIAHTTGHPFDHVNWFHPSKYEPSPSPTSVSA